MVTYICIECDQLVFLAAHCSDMSCPMTQVYHPKSGSNAPCITFCPAEVMNPVSYPSSFAAARKFLTATRSPRSVMEDRDESVKGPGAVPKFKVTDSTLQHPLNF